MSESVGSSIRHELYRRELLRYIGSMTIKFHPFAELAERALAEQGYTLENYRENPYYRNLAGEYGLFETDLRTGQVNKMQVYSVEIGQMVPFDRQLWTDYPQTASLYTLGSDAHLRLCMTYPNKTGLIKSIMYPVSSIDDAYNAEELTILRHEPSFLRMNEQESLYNAAKKCIAYVRDRWYIYDYGHEDQYYLVFMAQLYLNLFQALLKQRIDNQDTDAVHHMHVWDRLEANAMLPYEAIINDVQARWFYRNMRYLKKNRGRKSNLILLADSILRNLKVHLVGKRIFQQTEDVRKDCTTVPEFLNEEIIDYSVQIAESVEPEKTTNKSSKITTEYFAAGLQDKEVTSGLVDTNVSESMDWVLHRVYGEGYYPKYSVDNSAEKEQRFGRTVANTVPTRLLEFKKYPVYAPYQRQMATFTFQTLMQQAALGKLTYECTFVDPNTAVVVNMRVPDMLVLLHYACYKRFGITPEWLPNRCVVNVAFKQIRPRADELPSNFFWNHFNYRVDSVVDVEGLLDDIAWTNGRAFSSAASFVSLLGRQFEAIIKHYRSCYQNNHFTYTWCMWWLYQHICDRQVFKLRNDIQYAQWLNTTESAAMLINGYDQLGDSREGYEQLCNVLLDQLLPLQHSATLMTYAGALFDDTKYYTQLKELFQDWTSHDLTYLDTDRSEILYFNMMPMPATTDEHDDTLEIEMTITSPGCTTHLEEIMDTDFTKEIGVPMLVDTYQEDDFGEKQIIGEENKFILKESIMEEDQDTYIRELPITVVSEKQEEDVDYSMLDLQGFPIYGGASLRGASNLITEVEG